MLDKRLQLGGLQVGGPRTMQNSARFRVANNVYQTRDDYMIPRFHGEELLSPALFASMAKVSGVTRYQDSAFYLAIGNDNNLHFFKSDGTETPLYSNVDPLSGAPDPLYDHGPQFVEKLGCLYIGLPYNNLYKYDGYQTYKAGVPLPYIGCTEFNNVGTTYVRCVQHHLDLQGNVVNSGYVQFRVVPSGSNITLRVDQSAPDVLQQGSTEVSPLYRSSWEALNGPYDSFYFVASGAPVVGATSVTIPTGGRHNVKVGAYVLVTSPVLQSAATTGLPEDAYSIMLKVESFTGASVTLSLLEAKYLDVNRVWQEYPIPNTATFLTTIAEGTNYRISVWVSTAPTGAYVYKDVIPCLYNKTTSQTYTVNVASPTVPNAAYVNTAYLSGVLGDIYDVTSVKGVLPTVVSSPNEISYGGSCFSTYGDLMLMSYKNEIFFSDTTLGGSFEMINGLSFIVVGEGDDGDITSVCGNSDFMFVGRKYKNYYLVGSLPTANYRVQEISETSLGPYSNECSIAVSDKIIFYNKQGVWGLYTGGRCEEISYNVRGLFSNFSNTYNFDEESYFDLDAYPSYAATGANDLWMRLRLDVTRNLLAFVTIGDGQGEVLILNLNNGEFYTWDSMLYGYPLGTNPTVYDLAFINGFYYITANGDSANTIYAENKDIPRTTANYMVGDSRPRLKTSWFTAGQPSLEKKIRQMKLWGIIQGLVEMSHTLDWRQSEVVDDGEYDNQVDTELFSHKKRLDSSNALAVSVDMQFSGERMEIEGMELEFEPFQMGMKK